MESPRDPIQRVSDGTRDLYDVVTWEERTRVDRLAASVYGGLLTSARAVVVALAALIILAQLTLTGVATLGDPVLGAYILLSTVPALLLAAYVWKADVTRGEPLGLLVATFLLGFLFAGFAAVLNTTLQGTFDAIPGVGMLLFFYLVVGPVEETVKLLAVRLHAYRSSRFDAVVDGAVYGAVAGLGFATIENTIYITQQSLNAAGTTGGGVLATAAARTLAGPGHVIYSAFAGYYLGLAKFNPESRGPIVVKGLLIAVFIHGTYNGIVTYLPVIRPVTPVLSGMSNGAAFIAFVVVYDGVFGYLLYRKLARYRSAYRDLDADAVGAEGSVPDADAVFDSPPDAALESDADSDGDLLDDFDAVGDESDRRTDGEHTREGTAQGGDALGRTRDGAAPDDYDSSE